MKESYRRRSSETILTPSHVEAAETTHPKRWTGAGVGWVSRSSELRNRPNQGVDGVSPTGRQQDGVRKRECAVALRSRRPQACTETSRARTERPCRHPVASWVPDRWEKAMSYKATCTAAGSRAAA